MAIERGSAREVWVSEGAARSRATAVALERARVAGVPVQVVAPDDLDGLGRPNQGAAARVRLPQTLSERALSEPGRFGPQDLVVVLDGIEDPQNVGAAARAALGAGASLLVLRERRAAGITPGAVRASAGALVVLPVARVANIPRALRRLQEAGFTVVGLDGDAPVSALDGSCPDGPVALVVGSEVEGMSRLVRETCDLLVRLPMRGDVESLNAAAALAAALWAYVLPSRTPPAT